MIVLPALLLLLADPFSLEGPLSSADLVALCDARSKESATACTVYLRGAFEGLISAEMSLTDGDPTFCLPDDGVSLAEVRTNFVHYVAADPEQADMGASAVLLASLEDNYPCFDDEDDETVVAQLASASAREKRGVHAAKVVQVQRTKKLRPDGRNVRVIRASFTQRSKVR